MSQWGVQLVIGKLMTDKDFRQRFESRGRECLAGLCEQGIELNDAEVAAFVETDRHLWSKLTMRIDARLRTLGRRETGDPRHHRPLTLRERQVLRGIFEGLTNKQIATDVGVTEGAVKATLQSLFRKTYVRTRAQLVRIAIEGSLGPARDER